MRLPPSSTAWRMAAARPGSGAGCAARASPSTRSIRARQPSSRARAARAGEPGSGMVAGGRERRRGLGLLRIGEQAHAQLGLLQRLLAATVEADAALIGGERLLQAHVAVLHLLHELLEGVERGFEVGDRGGV